MDMKKMILCLAAALGLSSGVQAKDLVAYFSATGNTQRVAEEIARLTGADLLRIEAAEPYAANPYDDSDRIQGEAYGDLRPGVANLPEAAIIAQYDRIFVGSPIWWHQPAMVVCTFLEAFDLTGKTIIPFFTYGATTYLNESMQKIYKVTPNSIHVPETLPEDLNPDDITTPGAPDDSGIDMPGNARGVEAWLERLGLLGGEGAVGEVLTGDEAPFRLSRNGDMVQIDVSGNLNESAVEVYRPDGLLLRRMERSDRYDIRLPQSAVYLISFLDRRNERRYSLKLAL